MQKILVLHGPNLNLLGMREPHIYGSDTLDTIHTKLRRITHNHANIELSYKQSNSESELIEYVHEAYINQINFIIINPAAFTHTSIALLDALLAVNIPFIEVHLSNIHAREEFRHKSYFSAKAKAVISGMGAAGYEYALLYLLNSKL